MGVKLAREVVLDAAVCVDVGNGMTLISGGFVLVILVAFVFVGSTC